MAEFIKWEDIDHKNRTTGIAKLKCPTTVCLNRVKKHEKALYVHYGSGIARCFHCDALSFRDSVTKKTEKVYTIPSQDWKNYTDLPDNVVKYIESRGINQFTANELQWTHESFYQMSLQKTVNNLVFNYFEGDVLVSKKYRSRCKNFMQTKGAKNILYNINSVIGKEEAYITEGEIDVASLYEIGIKNAVSVPNGANNKDDYWVNSMPYMEGIKKFYICTDMDEKGNALAELIAHRLGRYRCERVLFEGKDANDDLVKGVLKKSIKNTKSYPVSGTHTVSSLYDKILDLHANGLPPVIYPKNPAFAGMRNVFSLMFGHLCISTGIPSHGKSNFTEWYVLNLIAENNYKASFFSPEHHPMELHQSTFIEKFTGKNFFIKHNDKGERDDINGRKVDEIDIAKYLQWADEKLYLTSPDGNNNADWTWLMERFQEQIYKYGINIFVVDAWNKVEFDPNEKGEILQKTSKALSRLASFAQRNNVIVILVAHPTKMNKDKETGIYEIPDLYNVSGSADFRNQTHDGYCIYRYFKNENNPESENFMRFINLKTKMKFQGEMMSFIDFEYHLPSGRYYKKGEHPDLNYLVEVTADGKCKPKYGDIKEDILDDYTKIPLPLVSPNEAFKKDETGTINDDPFDDCPF